MGDPRRIRSKFQTPTHPWQRERIDEERVLTNEYGLKNKKEIWKIRSKLRNFLMQTKKLVALTSKQAEKERKQLLDKVQRIGLLSAGAPLADILGLKVNDLMNRRLQTLVQKRGMARTVKQARQFIVHEHILVNNKKVTSPSYIVSVEEEPTIAFAPNAPLAKEDHPERVPPEKPTPKEKMDIEEKVEEKKESKEAPKKEKQAEAKEKSEKKGMEKEAIKEEKKEEKKVPKEEKKEKEQTEKEEPKQVEKEKKEKKPEE